MKKLVLALVVLMLVLGASLVGAEATCSVPYSFSSGQTASASQVNTNFSTIANCANAAGALRGYIGGLGLSTAGGSSSYGIAAGAATDSAAASPMVLATSYTKTTSGWTVGSGNGSLDTGTVANNTWYHVYLIERADTGVVDVLVSLSATSPSLPGGYTLFRRIGSMKTDGSAHWLGFVQFGNQFIWSSNTASALDVNMNPTGTQSAQTVNVPTGVQVVARLRGWVQSGSSPLVVTISSPSETSLTSANGSYAASVAIVPASGPTATQQGFTLDVLTNTSGQINIVGGGTDGSSLVRAVAYGWYDARGAN